MKSRTEFIAWPSLNHGRRRSRLVTIVCLAPQTSYNAGVFSSFTFRSFGTSGGDSILTRSVRSGHIESIKDWTEERINKTFWRLIRREVSELEKRSYSSELT